MQTTKLDRLVNRVTAFRSWAEMRARLDTGYVPTIKGRTKGERDLAKSLELLGYRSWQG